MAETATAPSQPTSGLSSPWITLEEAAAYCHLHPDSFLRKRRRGELRGIRCGSNGRRLLFHRGDLDAWLQGTGRPV